MVSVAGVEQILLGPEALSVNREADAAVLISLQFRGHSEHICLREIDTASSTELARCYEAVLRRVLGGRYSEVYM